MPVLWNAVLLDVRAAGGTDQSEGTGPGALLWSGEARAYYRQNARAVSTTGGQGVLSSRVLYLDRGLPVDLSVGNVVRFVRHRSLLQVSARIVEVVGTEAPPGLPASIDTVKLLLSDPVR